MNLSWNRNNRILRLYSLLLCKYTTKSGKLMGHLTQMPQYSWFVESFLRINRPQDLSQVSLWWKDRLMLDKGRLFKCQSGRRRLHYQLLHQQPSMWKCRYPLWVQSCLLQWTRSCRPHLWMWLAHWLAISHRGMEMTILLSRLGSVWCACSQGTWWDQ